MKTKFYLSLILIFTVTFFENCKKDDTNTTPPAVKKYYISALNKNSVLEEQFTYNTNNKLIKWQATDTSGSPFCEFTYNTSGVLTDLTFYSNSITYGSVSVEMNSSNNPAKVLEYTLYDTTTITFEYNAGGNLIKLNYYFGPDVLISQNYGYLALTYDANANVTREVFNDIPANVRFQYDYLYDSKNSPLYYSELKWPYFILMNYFSGENISHFISRNNVVKNTQTIPTPVDVINSTYIYNTDGYPTQMSQGSDVYDIEYIVK